MFPHTKKSLGRRVSNLKVGVQLVCMQSWLIISYDSFIKCYLLFLSKSKVCLFVIYELYQEVVLTGSHQGTTICTIQKTCKSISIVNRLEISFHSTYFLSLQAGHFFSLQSISKTNFPLHMVFPKWSRYEKCYFKNLLKKVSLLALTPVH